MTFIVLLLGIIIGIVLTLGAQACVIAILVYTEKPKNRIVAIAEEARRRIKGKGEIIQPESPIQQTVRNMMSRNTLPQDR